MDNENYVIGRGKIYIDNRYIGSTSEVTWINDSEGLRLRVVCSLFSKENFKEFLKGSKTRKVRYESMNIVGRSTDFELTSKETIFDPVEFKADDWIKIVFTFKSITFEA